MKVHIHPNQWLHHERHGRTHVTDFFHNEVFWIVTVALVVLVTATVLMLLAGKTPTVTTPYLPSFPF